MNVLGEILKKSDERPLDYESDVAYLMSVMSTWCYADADTLTAVLERKNVAGGKPKAVKQFNVTNPVLPVDANGTLVSYNDKFHVLCFRGTEPTHILDLLTDALIEPHVWNGDRKEWVHRGFFLSLDVLWPMIDKALAGLDGDLFITGHSMGGSIAALAGRKLQDRPPKDGPRLRGVYTFGQLMVGNRLFGDNSKGVPLYRHVYDRDIATRLPPTGLGAGDYEHHGRAYVSKGTGASKVWKYSGADKGPERCHASEILPSFLTLMTARTQDSSIPLLAATYGLRLVGLSLGLSFSAKDLKETVASIPQLFKRTNLSLDDHIPTHYLDVSKVSANRTSELASI